MAQTFPSIPIPRGALINKLRELGYEFKRQAKNTYIYKKGTTEAHVPRSTFVDSVNVTAMLGYADCSAEDIKAFIEAAKA